MDACKSSIFVFQFVKPMLQTITHLIQYTVLEIWFWSVKCTIVTVWYANISSISIPSHQAMQGIAMVYEIKLLQNAFKLKALHILIQIVYYIDYCIAEK